MDPAPSSRGRRAKGGGVVGCGGWTWGTRSGPVTPGPAAPGPAAPGPAAPGPAAPGRAPDPVEGTGAGTPGEVPLVPARLPVFPADDAVREDSGGRGAEHPIRNDSPKPRARTRSPRIFPRTPFRKPESGPRTEIPETGRWVRDSREYPPAPVLLGLLAPVLLGLLGLLAPVLLGLGLST